MEEPSAALPSSAQSIRCGGEQPKAGSHLTKAGSDQGSGRSATRGGQSRRAGAVGFPAAFPAEPVLGKTFRPICGISRSHARSCTWERTLHGCVNRSPPRWISGECVCTQRSFCSPFHIPYPPGVSEFPGGRELVSSLNGYTEAGVLLFECCQEPPPAFVQRHLEEMP